MKNQKSIYNSFQTVHIGDLKSAVLKPHHNFNCGEYVTLQLMYRNKDSLQVQCAKTVTEKTKPVAHFPRFSDDTSYAKHSKLIMAEPQEILSIIERERTELKCQLVSDGIDCPDSVFVQQALSLLEEREKNIQSQLINNTHGQCHIAEPVSIAELNVAIKKIVLNSNDKDFNQLDQKDDSHCSLTLNDLDDSSFNGDLSLNDIVIASENVTSIENCFYFYQSIDGQHLYLHSINVRMLHAMFGSLECAPKVITGRILQKESFSMTEELRKRLKYLQHMPVTCQFDVVEIELESPQIISEEVQYKFKDELIQRQKNRQKRAREERKREKHIDRENERRIGKIIHTAINIDVSSEQQFPSVI